MTVEISLVKTYNLTTSAPPSTFIIMTVLYVVGQYYILEFVGRKLEVMGVKGVFQVTVHKIVKLLQYLISIILVVLSLQMITTSHYDSFLLILITTTSYALAIFMLGLLTSRFISWFRLNRNVVVLFYGLASGVLSINAAITLAFVYGPFLNLPKEIKPNLQEVYYLPIPGSVEYLLNSAYTISSIISFILTWVATVLLLHSYTRKFGRIKYWIIVTLPLIYFLSQFPSFSLNLFASLLNTDPVFYGIFLSVVFIVSKAAGGILFGIAFWLIARTISRDNVVRQYLIIAAVGFVLLFVSDQAPVLTNAPYPPLGLASISFMGLASYLILIGIYSSAISVSEDSKLRQTIRGLTSKEPKLLDSIGSAHMEQEIQKKVLEFTKRNKDRMAEETGIQSSLTEEDMKSYLQEVIKEIQNARRGNNNHHK
ncbi:MAG: hypothetical protein M3044_00400 [Thermoproteota archaeon]|nr:hypothetical protein [Thermoproteota archaeon]